MYKPLKTQIGISAEADFENSTWTFQLQPNYIVAAGQFAIVDKLVYDDLLKYASSVLKEFSYGGDIPDDLAAALNNLQQLVNSELEDAVSDTTGVQSSNAAGKHNIS